MSNWFSMNPCLSHAASSFLSACLGEQLNNICLRMVLTASCRSPADSWPNMSGSTAAGSTTALSPAHRWSVCWLIRLATSPATCSGWRWPVSTSGATACLHTWLTAWLLNSMAAGCPVLLRGSLACRLAVQGESERSGARRLGTVARMVWWRDTREQPPCRVMASTRAEEAWPAPAAIRWRDSEEWPWNTDLHSADWRLQLSLSSIRDWEDRRVREARARAWSPRLITSMTGVVLCTSAMLTLAPSSSILCTRLVSSTGATIAMWNIVLAASVVGRLESPPLSRQ